MLARIDHVPCSAGSLVLWDWRIPHANARENTGDRAREVVYLGFLPPTSLNHRYAQDQLASYQAQRPPVDQWHHGPTSRTPMPVPAPTAADAPASAEDATSECTAVQATPDREADDDFSFAFSPLGRRLMAMDPWLPS